MSRRHYLWAMRHARTTSNDLGLLQGQGDAPLSEAGVREACEAARLLSEEGIERIVASDLGRARATAELVADRLGLPVATADGWREVDYGRDLVGRPVGEIVRLPGSRGEPDFRFPGGESWREVEGRVLAALAEVVADPRPTLVVTHRGPLRVLLARARALPLERLAEVEAPRRLIVRFELNDGRPGAAVVLRG